MSSVEDIVRRLDARPDHTVANYREVGLPVFLLDALFALQEETAIGPIHEFMLRCIKTGIGCPREISNFLGLPTPVVNKQIGAFLYEGVVSRKQGDKEEYELTRKGRVELTEAMKTKISTEQVPVYVDGMTRRVTGIDKKTLYNARQLDALGIALIPAIPTRPPRAPEIDLAEVNRVFRIIAGSVRPTRKALKLEALVGRSRLYYLKGICIAYKSLTSGKITVAFAADGRLLEDHEITFARSKQVGRTKLFDALLDPNKRRREVQKVARYVRDELPTVYARLEQQSAEPGRRVIRLRKPNEEPSVTEAPSLVKALHVYEHAPLLKRALEEAEQRLLIISPWVRAEVVDSKFIDLLVQCLRRGTRVIIAYGLGRIERGERERDKEARDALEGLAGSFENFEFTRKGNTHAKVLLVDSKYCVTTSFNWLSFRGDPNQPFREEWGTYIEGQSLVDRYYEQIASTLA